MGKWGATYVVKLDTDKATNRAAEHWAQYLNLTVTHKLTKERHEVGWTSMSPDAVIKPLAGCTHQDRILIFCHGSTQSVSMDYIEPDDLAKMFAASGLREVGLITFKACYIGRESFLSHFKRACAKVGIKVGWLKAYRGQMETEEGEAPMDWDQMTDEQKAEKMKYKPEERVLDSDRRTEKSDEKRSKIRMGDKLIAQWSANKGKPYQRLWDQRHNPKT